MKHTKSPSGKTHRLTDRQGESVTLRYRERPQFDDQVQGDLIRSYRTKTGSGATIGRLEAAQRGYATAPLNVGAGGPISGIPPQGPPPAAGAASIQINEVERPRVSRLDEGVRRVREAERNGW